MLVSYTILYSFEGGSIFTKNLPGRNIAKEVQTNVVYHFRAQVIWGPGTRWRNSILFGNQPLIEFATPDRQALSKYGNAGRKTSGKTTNALIVRNLQSRVNFPFQVVLFRQWAWVVSTRYPLFQRRFKYKSITCIGHGPFNRYTMGHL